MTPDHASPLITTRRERAGSGRRRRVDGPERGQPLRLRADLPKPEWGRYTQQGNRLYAHIYERGIGPINFRGLSGRIKSAASAGRRVRVGVGPVLHDRGLSR